MRRLVAIYARLGAASHRTPATTAARRQLAAFHQGSGPEASSTCPPRDLWSILRRRLTEARPHPSTSRAFFYHATQLIMANPIACTSVPSQITAPHQFSCNRGTRSLRKAGGSEGLVVASAPRGGALHPSDEPQVARARRRHLRKHAPTKMQNSRHRKKPSQYHRSSSTCPSAASRRGASR